MEDPSHSDALGSQGVILLHCLLCLEDPHINALFLEVLHSGWRHLGRAEKMSKSGERPSSVSFPAMRQGFSTKLDNDNGHYSITQRVTSPKFDREPQGVSRASKKLTEASCMHKTQVKWKWEEDGFWSQTVLDLNLSSVTLGK